MWIVLGWVYFIAQVIAFFLAWIVVSLCGNRDPNRMSEADYKLAGTRGRFWALVGSAVFLSMILPRLLIPRERYELDEKLVPVSISTDPTRIVVMDSSGRRVSKEVHRVTIQESDTSSVTLRLKTTGHKVKETWYSQLLGTPRSVDYSEHSEATVEYPRGRASDVLELMNL